MKCIKSGAARIALLAQCSNIHVKLGGVGSLRSGYDWHERAIPPSSEELAAALKPYFEWCIEKFGPNRCLFESNFPVERQSNGYVTLWNAFKRLTQKLFRHGARRAVSRHGGARLSEFRQSKGQSDR